MAWLCPSLLLAAVLILISGSAAPASSPPTAPKPRAHPSYASDVKPLLVKYCYDCHGNGKRKGELRLDRFPDQAALLADRKTWSAVLDNVLGHVMPPRDEDQPGAVERETIKRWIEAEVLQCDGGRIDPGRVTIRRLNRTEYNHTIRDLVGVDFQPADDFPADDTGYGFDNIGDVLSLPPLLLEKYLTAAEAILDQAIVTEPVAGQSLPESHRRIFFVQPAGTDRDEVARRILERFVTRAYRRPATRQEVERLWQLGRRAGREGESFEGSIKIALEAVLVSPHFLFRGEFMPRPDNPDSIRPVDDFALASRLSYFLWSTMPDDELFKLAEKGRLRRSLPAQVNRMLQDPKSRALVVHFASQWLQLPKLTDLEPDAKRFPDFDGALRTAMLRETELFLEGILREDRSVLELLDSDYTYANARLARHYGMEASPERPFNGEEFQKVSLRRTPRGGLLTQASILTLTSNPTRTSPVKRGKWVLENILGSPPPPPPPDVPELGEVKLQGSLRQRVEQHRDNPLCASCHARMDPIGFGFENFDAIGAWREMDDGFPVEPGGELLSGETFKTPAELRTVLMEHKREEFLRCLAGKMLTYALGRGLEYQDRCAVDEIVAKLQRDQHRFSALVLAVAESVPFQYRRGDGSSAP